MDILIFFVLETWSAQPGGKVTYQRDTKHLLL